MIRPRAKAKLALAWQTSVFGVLCVLFAGCGDQKQGQIEMNETVKNEVQIKSTFRNEGNTIEVETTLQNDSAEKIYVFSPLATFEDGEPAPQAERVYIEVDEATCVLQKALFDIPDEVDVYMPEVPFLTMVEPGKSFTEKITVASPSVSFPYDYASDLHEGDVEVTHLVMKYGYVVESEEIELDSLDDGLFSISYGDGIANQQIVTSETHELSEPVTVAVGGQ